MAFCSIKKHVTVLLLVSAGTFTAYDLSITPWEQRKFGVLNDSRYGDPCSVSKYKSFWYPQQVIIGNISTDLEEIDGIGTDTNFTYKTGDSGPNSTLMFDKIPDEFERVICKSMWTPLMCVPNKPGDDNGHCKCLEMEVGKVNVVTTLSMTEINVNLVLTGIPLELPPPQEKSGSTTSSSSNTKAKAGKAIKDVSGEKGTSSMKDGSDKIDNSNAGQPALAKGPVPVSVILNEAYCYARIGDRCVTPYIPCEPVKDKKERWISHCTRGVCSDAVWSYAPSWMGLLTTYLSLEAAWSIYQS